MAWVRALLRVLTNRTLILGLGFAMGLVLGQAARLTTPLTLPALAVLIALAASEIAPSAFRNWRRVAQATGLAVLSTYVINSGAILLLARLLVPEPQLYTGYVLVAASPPAASALAFCIALRGDVALSLIGTVGTYVAALGLGPAIAFLFAGRGLIQPGQLFTILVQLIAIPLAASRLLRLRPIFPYVRRWRELAISLAYSLVIFTVVGVNREVFFSQPALIGLIGAVAVGSTFVLGAVVEVVLRRRKVDRKRRVSLVLFSTLKNTGFAAAVALAIISQRASLPGAVASVVNSLFLIVLGLVGERQKEQEHPR